MKRTRVCPKCSGNRILIVDGYAGPYASGNNIMVGATVFSAVNVDRYVCARCGYSEEWIRTEDIPKLERSRKVHL